MGDAKMQAMLQEHVNHHATYGGHDGKGGLQKPKASKPRALTNPSPTGSMFRENVVPQTGPASAAGTMRGPMGSGGSTGAGN